jgi:hypothetical protein
MCRSLPHRGSMATNPTAALFTTLARLTRSPAELAWSDPWVRLRVPTALEAEFHGLSLYVRERLQSASYFSRCSFDSILWPGAVTAVSNVKKTRRSTMPDKIRTSPMRKSPIVSGRSDSDVRIICTRKRVQAVGQTHAWCNSMKIQLLNRAFMSQMSKGVKQSGKLVHSFSDDSSFNSPRLNLTLSMALREFELRPRGGQTQTTRRSQPSRQ